MYNDSNIKNSEFPYKHTSSSKDNINFSVKLHKNIIEPSLILIDKKYYYIGDEGVAKKTNQIYFNLNPEMDLTTCIYNLPDGVKVLIQGDCLCTETLFNPYKCLHDFHSIIKLNLLNSTKDDYDFRNALYQNIVLTGGNFWLDEIQNNIIIELQNQLINEGFKQDRLNKEFLNLLNGNILVSK